MREFKFRRWNKAQERMRIVAVPGNGDMQYTGLKDKNGAEVFEGDIVRWHGTTGAEHIEPVTYYQAGFYPRKKRSFQKKPLHAAWIYNDGFEVIGNIHANPELLTREDN